MKRQVQPKQLSRAPQSINADTWYYEDRGGLCFVVWLGHESITFTVPWRKIKATMVRYDEWMKDAKKRKAKVKRGK